MKKLLFGLLMAVAGVLFFACSQKGGFLGNEALKTNANDLVAFDSQVENVVEIANYESDLFSLGNSSVMAYGMGLKSAEIGGVNFRNMFDLFPNFKFRYLKGVCPDFTVTSTNGGFPRTMTIDYGTGLELTNGHVLKGKIIIVLSGAPFVPGSVRTVTYENFCTDSVCIAGTATKSRTKDVQPKFSEKSDMTVTKANGNTIHRVEEHIRTWVAGSDTEFNPADDIIELSGKVVVSDSKGNEYSKTITTPLVRTGLCKFITKGVIEYKTSAGKFATIDYGDGACDNKATRTTQSGTTEITLGRQ